MGEGVAGGRQEAVGEPRQADAAASEGMALRRYPLAGGGCRSPARAAAISQAPDRDDVQGPRGQGAQPRRRRQTKRKPPWIGRFRSRLFWEELGIRRTVLISYHCITSQLEIRNCYLLSQCELSRVRPAMVRYRWRESDFCRRHPYRSCQ